MFALVQWVHTKEISIVRGEDIIKLKEENCETYVKHGKKSYKAIIKKFSDDKKYLESLDVTIDGDIIMKRRGNSKVELQKRKIEKEILAEESKKRKLNNFHQRSAIEKINKEILETKSIFTKSMSDEASDSDISQCSKGSSAHSSKPSEKETIVDSDEDFDRLRKHRLSAPPKGSDINDLPSCSGEPLRLSISQVAKEFDDKRSTAIDPLKMARVRGEGRVRLKKKYNVWIDKTELDFVRRWYNKPKEMTRRLLKHLVGEKNLITMSALGRKTTSCNREPIPRDILLAVETFVKSECTNKLSGTEFITCVNMMISTLRNPKTK